MVNQESLTRWLDDLAHTTAPQCQGALSKQVLVNADGDLIDAFGAPKVGYCCLGRGDVVRGATTEGHRTEERALAGRGFLDWLGFDMTEHDDNTHECAGSECDCEFDLWVAWPDEYRVLLGEDIVADVATGAGLNDGGFTFKQIADIFRYFGVSDRVAD